MVSRNPARRPAQEGIPPAFRGRVPAAASFIGLDDRQVIAVAAAAHRAALALPVGSRERAAAWARFDDATSELSGRAFRQTVAKIREHIEAGDDVPEALREAAMLEPRGEIDGE